MMSLAGSIGFGACGMRPPHENGRGIEWSTLRMKSELSG
jgi:hypothetical protein